MNERDYIVTDLDKFVESIRQIVYAGFGDSISEGQGDEEIEMLFTLNPEEMQEMDSVLSQKECMLIIKPHLTRQKNKKGTKFRYLINTDQFNAIIDDFNSRLVSNLLANLVNKGVIETAYDPDENDFIFWVKEDAKNKKKNKEN